MKKAGTIFWDDSILLIVFNLFTFLSILPALLVNSLVQETISIVTSLITTLLFFPIAFFLFALFSAVHNLSQGNVVKVSDYFHYMRQMGKQAFVWGALNLLSFLLFGWNLRFYAQFDEAWGAMMQLLFLSLAFIWFVLQLLMLPIYPRLQKPGFKLALRNAAGMMGRYPFPLISIIILIAFLLTLTFLFQFAAIFFTFALITVLLEGLVSEILKIEIKPDAEEN
ncbi:MAG: hypothetical protein R6X34_04375 [Chloroflexota bacterium]